MQLLSKVCAVLFFSWMHLIRKDYLGNLFLSCIVINVLCCLSDCQEEDACRPCDGFSVPCKCTTVQAGSPAEFRCTGQYLETSQWRVQRPNHYFDEIAQSGVLFSYNRLKFNLYVNESSANNSSRYLQILTLNKTTVEDDGIYRCEEEGQISTLTSLIVETVPRVQLQINNTVITTKTDVVLSREVAIKCVAEGGKPQGTLSWMVNGEEKRGRFIDNPQPSSGMVTSTIHLLPTIEDRTLTCVSSGQKLKPQTSVSVDLNVQYPPNCVLGITNGTGRYDITCSCKANPEVKKYEIYKNNILFSNGKKATLSIEMPATVFCIATNDINSFTTEQESLKPFHAKEPSDQQQPKTGLIVGPSVVGLFFLGLVAAVIWYFYKEKKKAETSAKVNKDMAMNAASMLNENVKEQSMQQTPEKQPMMEGDSNQVENQHEVSNGQLGES